MKGNRSKKSHKKDTTMKTRSFPSTTRSRITMIVVLAIFASVGAWILSHSFAASPTASVSCGANVQNYTYQVPWGNAAWNQPVCSLPRSAQSSDYASRFFKWSNANDGTAEAQQAVAGNLRTNIGIPKPTLLDPEGLSSLFGTTLYDAADATTTTKIHAANGFSNLDGTAYNPDDNAAGPGLRSKNPDTEIPWNPNWRTGEGGDNEMIILDKQSGKIYEIAGYKRGLAATAQCGIYANGRICTYNTRIGRDYNGNIIDYRTFEGFLDRRGIGLSMYATFTTPEEVKAGEIRHALGVSIPNTATGPECSSSQLGTAAEGTNCGTAVAPATKFEWGSVSSQAERGNLPAALNSIYTQNKMIPEGTRFALDMTYDQINAWAENRTDLQGPDNAAKKSTAITFARALRDYGMFITDTNGANASIELSGAANPDAKQKWSDLGISTEKDYMLLKGLITSSNLYVVEPPTVKCLDNTTSKYYCQWSSASYGTSPVDTTPPTVAFTTPANNATLKGTVSVAVNATDNVGVTKVEFLIDNSVKATASTSPYTFTFNTATLTNAVHSLSVKAYDAAGKVGTTTISVTVDNSVQPPAKIGDFTGDGRVTITDLSVLLSKYGQTVTAYQQGDCDGDSRVGISDLAILLSNYGK